jgi:adenylyltransferase/sulfurtransferase
MMEYEAYFHRQIELWGRERQERLKYRRIVIIGCGGLGSTLAMALGCTGIGEIDLVDFDNVSLHNIHRQIMFTLDDLKRNKAIVTAELLGKKNPYLETRVFECDFEEFSRMDREYDLILDATDNLPVRAEIDRWAKERGTPWIYGSVEAFNGQVCFFEESGFQVFATKSHKPAGIAAPIVMQIGSVQANMALRYLLGLPVKKDILHYIYYDEYGELTIRKFTMPTTKGKDAE